MSRSYRKPVAKLKNNTFFKKYYNRKVRLIRKNNQDMASGNSYKKYNCSYDICDFNTGLLDKTTIQKWYGDKDYQIKRK